MIGVSWNCRGIGYAQAISELKALLRSHRIDFIFLIETRLHKQRFNFLKSALGFSAGLMVDRVGMGRGLALLWRDHVGAWLISLSPGHIDVWVSNWTVDCGCFFTGFYGHWQPSQRIHSWNLLRRIGQNMCQPWCILGDFNELLNSS